MSPFSFEIQVSHQIQRHLLQSLPAARGLQHCASWRSDDHEGSSPSTNVTNQASITSGPDQVAAPEPKPHTIAPAAPSGDRVAVTGHQRRTRRITTDVYVAVFCRACTRS